MLRHERIAVLSYPYEWSFEMLRDAARLQLDLVSQALAEDLITKDASAYNVQFVGAVAPFHRRRVVRAAAPRASRGPATASSTCTSCCP